MSENFRIHVREHDGDLHLRPVGDFDHAAAWETIRVLSKMYDGKGKVFIDTEQLGQIGIFGCGTFLCQFYLSGVPRERLVFLGENGYRIAPKGSMVVASSQPCHCHCDGNCENCRCAQKRKIA